jgi:hypothetical protein
MRGAQLIVGGDPPVGGPLKLVAFFIAQPHNVLLYRYRFESHDRFHPCVLRSKANHKILSN